MSADSGQDRPEAEEAGAEAQDAGAAPAAAEAADGADEGGARGGDAGDEASELEALRAEREELFTRLQRLSAEFDNFQKRVKRERAKWSQEAIRDVVEGLLPVLDNLDYAVAAFDRETKDLASLRQGVELVREELRRQLGNRGVEPIEASEGTPYDPDRHQAIGIQEVEGIEEEQVAYLARPGYAIGDAILRPAQVGVSKPAKG